MNWYPLPTKHSMLDQASFVEAWKDHRQHKQHELSTRNPKSARLMLATLNDPRGLMSNPVKCSRRHAPPWRASTKSLPVRNAPLHAKWSLKRTPICEARGQIYFGNFMLIKKNEPFCYLSSQRRKQRLWRAEHLAAEDGESLAWSRLLCCSCVCCYW